MSYSATYQDLRYLRRVLPEQDEFRQQVDLVWMAMTDWVERVYDCGELVKILRHELQSDLRKANLEAHRRGFRGSYGIPGIAWKGETLADLEHLFAYYPEGITLEEIFESFSQGVQQKVEQYVTDDSSP